MTVPCRGCFECLKSYQNDWKIRILEECKDWKNVFFWTLTYRDSGLTYVPTFDDESGVLELTPTLHKKDVQNLFKRFRINWERDFPDTPVRYYQDGRRKPLFKYFYCGEYGAEKHRPHYHLLFFTDQDYLEVRSRLSMDWHDRFGYFNFLDDIVKTPRNGLRGDAVSNYVSKYCSKGSLVTDWEREHPSIQKTFRCASMGLGLSYVNRMKEWHLGNVGLTQWSGYRKYLFDPYIGYDYWKTRGSCSLPSLDFRRKFISNHPPKTVIDGTDISTVFKPDYLDWILDHKFYHMPGTDLKYRLPKYYADRIFKRKEVFRRSWIDDPVARDKGFQVVGRKDITVTRFVSSDLLSRSLKDVLLARASKVHDSQLRALEALFPDGSFSEVAREALGLTREEIDARKQRARDSLASYYLKHDHRALQSGLDVVHVFY